MMTSDCLAAAVSRIGLPLNSMHRLALFVAVFIGLCSSILAQEPAATRFGVSARFVPTGGSGVTATVPEAMISTVTVPLQITPEAMWLLTVAPSADGGHVTISVSDTLMIRPAAGTAAATPVTIAQGVYPFTFDRPITVLQTTGFRIEVTLRKL